MEVKINKIRNYSKGKGVGKKGNKNDQEGRM
jgi:hypothetical protein